MELLVFTCCLRKRTKVLFVKDHAYSKVNLFCGKVMVSMYGNLPVVSVCDFSCGIVTLRVLLVPINA